MLRWYTYLASFVAMGMQFSSFKISNVFLPAETIILSCFWVVFLARTPQNVVSFIWPVMTWKVMHQICYGFYSSIKKWLKLGQKKWFFSSFWKFFLCMLYYTLWVMSQYFSNGKILLRYSSVVDFISTGHVVVKFKDFLLIQYPWDGPFLGF